MRRLTKIQITLLAFTLCFSALHAETKEQRAESPHELRIGIGDPIITNASLSSGIWIPSGSAGVWNATFGKNAQEADVIMKNGRIYSQKGKMHTVGYFFVEYQYRINPYIGVGLNTNVYNIWKEYNVLNGYNEKVGEYREGYLYMDFVPRARFTFLHKQYVNLYASAGIGFAMSTNYEGKKIECAPKFETTLFGISIGENGFFGAAEFLNIAFTYPFIRIHPVQLFTASIGYRF